MRYSTYTPYPIPHAPYTIPIPYTHTLHVHIPYTYTTPTLHIHYTYSTPTLHLHYTYTTPAQEAGWANLQRQELRGLVEREMNADTGDAEWVSTSATSTAVFERKGMLQVQYYRQYTLYTPYTPHTHYEWNATVYPAGDGGGNNDGAGGAVDSGCIVGV
jgi:hypothetical protein